LETRDDDSARVNIVDLGKVSYLDAWAHQERAHAEVVAGGEERVLFVEHPPVITFGRRPGLERNLLASDERLATSASKSSTPIAAGTSRLHGPGQLVAYPIIRLERPRAVGWRFRATAGSNRHRGASGDERSRAEISDAIGVGCRMKRAGCQRSARSVFASAGGVDCMGSPERDDGLSYFDLIVPGAAWSADRVTSICTPARR
jgi:hypothetical protein